MKSITKITFAAFTLTASLALLIVFNLLPNYAANFFTLARLCLWLFGYFFIGKMAFFQQFTKQTRNSFKRLFLILLVIEGFILIAEIIAI